MEEVLDLVHKEFASATSVYDEEHGTYVLMSDEIIVERFEQFKKLHAQVWSEQLTLKSHFIIVGALLAQLRREEIYKVVCQDVRGRIGYSNFYKFCSDVFGFKKKTVQRLLKVYEEFCHKDSGLLDVQYINYSFSQLTELATMEKYRERIPVTMSVRNIKHLKELYKEYVPKQGQTVEDDLKEWQRRHEEEQAKKNIEKNALRFFPAKKSDEVIGKMQGSTLTPREEEQSETDSEDERLLSTPEVEVSFENISKGLLRQLELLGKIPGWQRVANIVTDALMQSTPRIVAARSEVVEKIGICGNYAKKLDELQTELKQCKNIKESEVRPKSGDKLNLKNEKARKEWLDNYRSWGVWLSVPEVNKTFYRYDFVNGYAVVIEVGMQYPDSWSTKKDAYEFARYSIIDDEHKVFNSWGDSYTAVVQWLTKNAKEI